MTDVIDNALPAIEGIGIGIEKHPAIEHILRSLFLQMTGFQEQKLKCIIWEIASHDYTYRYKLLNEKSESFGECSKYDQKKKVYDILIGYLPKSIIDKRGDLMKQSFDESKDYLVALLERSTLRHFMPRDHVNFKRFLSTKIPINVFGCQLEAGGNSEFDDIKRSFDDIYERIYKHRNRCAHNLTSYQENLPSIDDLSDNDQVYENYFIRFLVLMVIDAFFVKLYKHFIEQIY